MSVTLNTAGRTREVRGSLYLERWIEFNTGTDLVYSATGDLNTLDSRADTLTTGTMWYGAPSPGDDGYDKDDGPTWYGLVIRIPFKRLQASGTWHTLKEELKGFIEGAFPGEMVIQMISGPNRRFERPLPSNDIDNPAKFWLWSIEYD